jgi:hypothetical protein
MRRHLTDDPLIDSRTGLSSRVSHVCSIPAAGDAVKRYRTAAAGDTTRYDDGRVLAIDSEPAPSYTLTASDRPWTYGTIVRTSIPT